MHPEFLIPSPSSNLLDLGDPAAAAYMTEFLVTAVAQLRLDVARL